MKIKRKDKKVDKITKKTILEKMNLCSNKNENNMTNGCIGTLLISASELQKKNEIDFSPVIRDQFQFKMCGRDWGSHETDPSMWGPHHALVYFDMNFFDLQAQKGQNKLRNKKKTQNNTPK